MAKCFYFKKGCFRVVLNNILCAVEGSISIYDKYCFTDVIQRNKNNFNKS